MRRTAKSILREGMREGDLADLVLPLISVDEYKSLIDPTEAVVIGFYVHDEDAAKDLNRFLQKSPVPLLGTDVSPAPDQFGYYMVFVELMNNERLGENMAAILDEMSRLVNLDETDWHLRIRGLRGLRTFSTETVEQGLKRAAQKDKLAQKDKKKSEVIEYLQHSALRNAEFSDRVLVLEGATDRFCFSFVGFDRAERLLQTHKLDDVGMKCDIRSIARSNRIKRILGENWEASRIGSYILLHTDRDPRALLLKP